MTFKKGNKYRFKPKYTTKTLDKINQIFDTGGTYEDVIRYLEETHPDASKISYYRWIEKARLTSTEE